MTKNELIEFLNKIPGNPDIAFKFVNDDDEMVRVNYSFSLMKMDNELLVILKEMEDQNLEDVGGEYYEKKNPY